MSDMRDCSNCQGEFSGPFVLDKHGDPIHADLSECVQRLSRAIEDLTASLSYHREMDIHGGCCGAPQ